MKNISNYTKSNFTVDEIILNLSQLSLGYKVKNAYFKRTDTGIIGLTMVTEKESEETYEKVILNTEVKKSFFVPGDLETCLNILEHYELDYFDVIAYETAQLAETIEKIDPINSAQVRILYTEDSEIFGIIWGDIKLHCNRSIAEELCYTYSRDPPKSSKNCCEILCGCF
jgi:hypothetical protein